MKLRTCLLTLAILLSAASAHAGWVMHQQTPGGVSTVYMQDNMMRVGADGQGMVYDLNQGTVTMLDPGRKVYWTGRPQQLNQQMNQALDQRMEQALQSVPPEQREQMRAMMTQRMGRGGPGGPPHRQPEPQVEVKATGDYQKIAGYKARKYQVYVNGRLRQEMWMADEPGFNKDLDMDKMMELVHSMRPAGMGRATGLGWRTSQPMLELSKNGMPMMIVDHGRGGMQEVMKVTKVEKKPLAKSLFQPPAGYKQVNFSDMMR